MKLITSTTLSALIFLQNIVFSQSGLVSHYPLDGNAQDSFGANHGQIFGATPTTDRFGNANSAYHFNGQSYINLSNPTAFTNPTYTYSAWVNVEALPSINDAGSIIFVGRGQGLVYINRQTEGAVWGATIYNTSNVAYDINPSTTSNTGLNTWRHVVITRNENSLKIFIDGSLFRTSTTSVNTMPTYSFPNTNFRATIGNRPDDFSSFIQYFSGKIDDVSIYNRAISDAEVMAIYTGAYPAEGNASLILQVNNPTNDIIFNNGISPTETKELVRIKGTGKVGVGTAAPNSSLEINGTFGTKLKKIVEEIPVIIDETATVWYISNTSSVTLPPAAGAENRRYIIVNRKSQTKNLANSYIALNNSAVNTIPANTSIEIISDGLNWLQIK